MGRVNLLIWPIFFLLLPLTPYPLPLAAYCLPLTSYPLPLTSSHLFCIKTTLPKSKLSHIFSQRKPINLFLEHYKAIKKSLNRRLLTIATLFVKKSFDCKQFISVKK